MTKEPPKKRLLKPFKEEGKFAYDLVKANPQMTVNEAHAIVESKFPGYTKSKLRMLTINYNLPLNKRRRNPQDGPHRIAASTEVRTMPELAHAPIQSYHGRSRYLPTYYEL